MLNNRKTQDIIARLRKRRANSYSKQTTHKIFRWNENSELELILNADESNPFIEQIPPHRRLNLVALGKISDVLEVYEAHLMGDELPLNKPYFLSVNGVDVFEVEAKFKEIMPGDGYRLILQGKSSNASPLSP